MDVPHNYVQTRDHVANLGMTASRKMQAWKKRREWWMWWPLESAVAASGGVQRTELSRREAVSKSFHLSRS